MPITDYILGIAAGFLGVPGQTLLQGLVGAMDAEAERTRLSVRSTLLELAEDDALGAHGRQSRLERVRGESARSYRDWLRTRFLRYRGGGTAPELVAQLEHLGYPNASVVTWLDLALAGNPGAFGGKSSYFFVRIDPPHPFRRAARWDDGTLWDGGALWDIQGSEADIEDLRRTIQRWRPASMSCRFIDIIFTNVFGLPIDTVRIPLWEEWEIGKNGGANDDYNTGY